MFSDPITPSLHVSSSTSSPNQVSNTSLPVISDSVIPESIPPGFVDNGSLPIPVVLDFVIPDSITPGSEEHNSLPIPQETPISLPSLRRSSRPTKLPPYLQDYKCSTIMSNEHSQSSLINKSSTPSVSTKYPLSDYLNTSHLSPSYAHFCSLITSIPEPRFYHEAVKDPKWQEAMNVEIDALVSNNT